MTKWVEKYTCIRAGIPGKAEEVLFEQVLQLLAMGTWLVRDQVQQTKKDCIPLNVHGILALQENLETTKDWPAIISFVGRPRWTGEVRSASYGMQPGRRQTSSMEFLTM